MSQMLAEMNGRHRAQASSIQILKTAVVPASAIRRNHVLQMLPKGLKFPVVRRLPLIAKGEKKLFRAKRPTTYAK